MNRDVIIAGAGIAGCAAATALLRHGLRPCLLRVRTTRTIPAIEAIPPRAAPFFNILGWEEVLTAAGGVRVEGFENGLGNGPPFVHAGCYWHVDRTRLASAAFNAAVAAGAEAIDIDQPVPLPMLNEGSPLIVAGRPFAAAIDATGRSAAWMVKRIRHGRDVADLYTVSEMDQPSEIVRGAVAHIGAGWAYRIGLPGAVTIGIVRTAGTTPPNLAAGESILGTDLAIRWDVRGRMLAKIARRPAFAQSVADSVIADRLFAVGDAAFASSTISGQGVLFALASAVAVAASIEAVLHGHESESGVRYYRELVQANLRRHLKFSRAALSGTILAPQPETMLWQGHRKVICAAPMIQHSVKNFDQVSGGPVLILPSGDLARWYGEIDLVVLAGAARNLVSLHDLESYLCRQGWHPSEVRRSLAWCLREGFLREGD